LILPSINNHGVYTHHMSNYRTSYYYEILDDYKIKATSIRLGVLRAIYSFETEFTADQTMDELKQDIPTVKRDTVISALRLYKIRGLLISTEYATDRPFGGPVIKFNRKSAHT
jgi:Fe2+ or Zn2+ uptake regulation protein